MQAIHVVNLEACFARGCHWTTAMLVPVNSLPGGTVLVAVNSVSWAAKRSFGCTRQTRYCGRNLLNAHARTIEPKN